MCGVCVFDWKNPRLALDSMGLGYETNALIYGDLERGMKRDALSSTHAVELPMAADTSAAKVLSLIDSITYNKGMAAVSQKPPHDIYLTLLIGYYCQRSGR